MAQPTRAGRCRECGGTWIRPLGVRLACMAPIGELVDEFREDVLPLFATRDIKNHLNCIPFQEESLVYDLSFDVFMPATAPPLPAGAAG